MKKRINQYLSLGVMLLLIALVISLLPEYPAMEGAHSGQSKTNIAAHARESDAAPMRQN